MNTCCAKRGNEDAKNLTVKIANNQKLAEEVERLTSGKADDSLVTVDSENILFEHLNLLYGNVARISVKELKRRVLNSHRGRFK